MNRKAIIDPAPLKFGGGQWRVHLRGRTPVTRPNRIAAGMQASLDASKSHWLKNGGVPLTERQKDVLLLVVHGTLDLLGRSTWFTTRPVYCQCCGARTDKKEITDRGRWRLRELERKASYRQSKKGRA